MNLERTAQDWRICPACSRENALRVTVADGARQYRCIFCPHTSTDPLPTPPKGGKAPAAAGISTSTV